MAKARRYAGGQNLKSPSLLRHYGDLRAPAALLI
jgi:hypothetical protein